MLKTTLYVLVALNTIITIIGDSSGIENLYIYRNILFIIVLLTFLISIFIEAKKKDEKIIEEKLSNEKHLEIIKKNSEVFQNVERSMKLISNVNLSYVYSIEANPIIFESIIDHINKEFSTIPDYDNFEDLDPYPDTENYSFQKSNENEFNKSKFDSVQFKLNTDYVKAHFYRKLIYNIDVIFSKNPKIDLLKIHDYRYNLISDTLQFPNVENSFFITNNVSKVEDTTIVYFPIMSKFMIRISKKNCKYYNDESFISLEDFKNSNCNVFISKKQLKLKDLQVNLEVSTINTTISKQLIINHEIAEIESQKHTIFSNVNTK
jgi:hypothetical protein